MGIPGRKPSKTNFETSALLKEIAGRTSLPFDTVKAVFEMFTEVVTESMVRGEHVILRNFGSFEARENKGHMGGIKVRFKPAKELKQDLKKDIKPMDKLGVALDNESVLLAKVTGSCPSCKSELVSKDPPQCPNCGTAPFENRQSSANKNFGALYGKKKEE